MSLDIKNKKMNVLIILSILAVLILFPERKTFAQEITSGKTYGTVLLKEGWYKEGKDFYYYENGKKLKKCLKRIGKDIYGFDAEGKSICGHWKELRKYRYKSIRYYFNSKRHLVFIDITDKHDYVIARLKIRSGKKVFMYAYMDAIVKTIGGFSEKSGSLRVCNKRTGSQYDLWVLSENICRKDGTKFPYRAIKKGMSVRTFWKCDVLESYPGQIPYVIKLKVL